MQQSVRRQSLTDLLQLGGDLQANTLTILSMTLIRFGARHTDRFYISKNPYFSRWIKCATKLTIGNHWCRYHMLVAKGLPGGRCLSHRWRDIRQTQPVFIPTSDGINGSTTNGRHTFNHFQQAVRQSDNQLHTQSHFRFNMAQNF